MLPVARAKSEAQSRTQPAVAVTTTTVATPDSGPAPRIPPAEQAQIKVALIAAVFAPRWAALGRVACSETVQLTAPPQRVALTRQEAAATIGMSVDHFERHVQHKQRVIRTGRLVLVPVAEIERWAEREAALTLGSTR